MTFEAAQLILPQPHICRNTSAKVSYMLCKLRTYLNHPHSLSFLNSFEVLTLFSFIISCQCVKPRGEVGVNMSYSIWGNIRAGSWHLCTLKNPSNDTQLPPHCNFQVTRCETAEMGCFLRNTAKCSVTKDPSICSIYRQTETQDRSTFMRYFYQSAWFGALLFQIHPCTNRLFFIIELQTRIT